MNKLSRNAVLQYFISRPLTSFIYIALFIAAFILVLIVKLSNNIATGANLLTAAGTIALAVVAALQDRIRAWLMQPCLDIIMIHKPPHCHMTQLIRHNRDGQIIGTLDCYYCNLLVKNLGNQKAELVEVYAAELKREHRDGVFRPVGSFMPMNLRWSHIDKPFFEAISPKMEKHCDLGYIIKPAQRTPIDDENNPRLNVPSDQTLFRFRLHVRPTSKSDLIPPGKYHLVLIAAAANAKPVKKTLEITLDGTWYDDESEMRERGIGLQMLD